MVRIPGDQITGIGGGAVRWHELRQWGSRAIEAAVVGEPGEAAVA
jgi:hypothetical protein